MAPHLALRTDPMVWIWPTPLPDETLYSAVAQHHQLTRCSAPKRTLELLFESNSVFLGGGFPTHLRALARYLTGASPDWSEWRVLTQYTFLPYIQFFYGSLRIEKVRQLLLGESGGGLKISLGWVASRLGASEPLRGCPACYSADYSLHGRPYWHRAHQLPGVDACHVHRLTLVRVTGPAEGYGRFLLRGPPLTVATSEYAEANSIAASLAEWSHAFLSDPPTPIGADALRMVYLRRLEQLGFATSVGRIREREFHNWLRQSSYGTHLQNVSWLGMSAPEMISLDWATKLVRKPKNSQHPLKHILLCMALFDSIDSFRGYLSSQNEVKREGTQRSLARHAGLDCLGDIQWQSLRDLSGKTGLSVTTLSVELTRRGVAIQRRPKLLTDTLLQVIKAGLESGEPLTVLTNRFGVSLITLYRVLRGHPETNERRRNHLQRLELQRRRRIATDWLASNLEGTSQEFAALHNRNITWLRRHDSTWLKKFLKLFKPLVRNRTATVDWHARDLQLLKRLTESYLRVLALPGRPYRITRTGLGRESGAASRLSKLRLKLPLCEDFLTSVEDSPQSFHEKRLLWSMQELKAQGTPITRSTLVRHARIRQPSDFVLDKVLNHLNALYEAPGTVHSSV